MSWILTIPDGFSLQRIIKYSAEFLLPPFTVNPSMSVIERVEELDSKRILLLTISQVPAGLQIRTSQHLDSAESEEVSHKVWRMLRLGENLNLLRPNQKHLQRHHLPGGRLLRGATFFEDVIKALLLTHQGEFAPRNQLNAIQIIARLVDRLGGSLPSNPTRHAFPTCEKLQHSPTLLTELLGPSLERTLRELGKLCDTELAKIEQLQVAQCPLPILIHEINQLPGMRPAMLALLMLALGRYDYSPRNDYARHYLSPELPSDKTSVSAPDFSD